VKKKAEPIRGGGGAQGPRAPSGLPAGGAAWSDPAGIDAAVGDMGLQQGRQQAILQSLQRFRRPRWAIGELQYMTRGIRSPHERSTTLLSCVSLFNQLSLEDHDRGFERFLRIVGPGPDQRRAVTGQVVLGESLTVKLLRSILRTSVTGLSDEDLLADLAEQARSLRVMSVPESGFRGHFAPLFEEAGKTGFRLSVGPSVTVVYSRPEGPSLGMSIYGELPGAAYCKMRISEFLNDRGEPEWNLGVVSRNLKAGKIPAAKQDRHFPNSAYPGLGLRFNMLACRYVKALAEGLGIHAIDVSPSHYHLVFLNRRLGARFDPGHRNYATDTALFRFVEDELDRLGVGMDERTGKRRADYLLRRSHHVHAGGIRAPDGGMGSFAWHKPRMIIHLAGCRTAGSTRPSHPARTDDPAQGGA